MRNFVTLSRDIKDEIQQLINYIIDTWDYYGIKQYGMKKTDTTPTQNMKVLEKKWHELQVDLIMEK